MAKDKSSGSVDGLAKSGPLEPVSARPVKSFFVHMLTRDITLQDAILDLVDNSVDGVQRSETQKTLAKKRPYERYWAKLSFSADSFTIEDNCGGIPWESHEYAFRMGRVKQDIDKGRRTVGTYGIGMKRAIFKIGKDCIVTTHAKDKSYSVMFSTAWMEDDDDWILGAEEIARDPHRGTKIEIWKLPDSIKAQFGSQQFVDALREAVATHYAYIIQKGFSIYVNNVAVTPKAIQLSFEATRQAAAKDVIRPFIYEASHEGVDILVAVGLTRPIPSKEEADESLENFQERYSSAEAGWTVICNDRTVLYCDKTPLTGWGVSGVPQFHPQFTAISGIVIFTSDNPSLLPTTTTKRGIEAGSTLYLHVRDKMIEGVKLFTQYTNEWKTKELVSQSKERLRKVETLDVERIRSEVSNMTLVPTRGVIKGRQYKPELPRPTVSKTTERISFERPVAEVRKVSSYLFETADKEPKIVGNKCFELILEEASR